MTTAVITRAQEFVLSAEKKASAGEVCFQNEAYRYMTAPASADVNLNVHEGEKHCYGTWMWGGLLSQHMRPQRVNLISPLHLPPNPPIFLLLLLLIAILAQLVAIIRTRWNILMDVG